jgi:capsular exopolysaccharide synthesis family protein
MTPANASRNDGATGGARGRTDEASLHLPHLSDIDLSGLGRTVWRWRAMVIWTTLALTALSVVIVQHLTPLYTATGQVLVGVEQVKVNNVQDAANGVDTQAERVATQAERVATEIGVIRARDMAQRVIDKLGLDNEPEFNPALRSPNPIEGWLERQSIIPQGWLIKIGAVEDPATAPDATATMAKTVDNVMAKLKVTNDGQSRIINISFESQDPSTAAQVVNTLADAYIVSRLDQKFDAAKRANVWLADRLNGLRQDVLTSEDAVEKFRTENGLVQTSNSTLQTQEMSQVSAEAITARTKRLEAQARLARIQQSGGARTGTPDDSLVEVLQSPLIQQLRQQEADASRRLADLTAQYGDKHPKVIEVKAELADLKSKIQGEIGKVVESLRAEAGSQQARENSLNSMLEGMKQQAGKSGIADVQLRDLQRQADANRTLYENFLNQFKATNAQDQFQQPDAGIISRAEIPHEKSFPQKGALILLSALASLTLGVLFALLAQYLDVGVRSMEQVKSLLHVYPLGMIPAPQGLVKGKLAREIIDRPMSGYSEAVRTVHTNLMLSDVDQRPRVVLVTSSLPGEGKSTLSVSLAELAARYGQKVVIVDVDLRRPTIHRLTGASAKPGLVDWLLDRVGFDDILQRHTVGGVDVISAGELPTIPPNLLSSERFKQLLRGLGEQYDLVVLDSAPVLALSDTRVLSMLADRTIFVVRWASTSYRVAAAALQQVHESGGYVAGAVLNAVDVKAHAKDGFYDSVLYSGKLKEYYR